MCYNKHTRLGHFIKNGGIAVKKLICLALAMFMLLSLASCFGDGLDNVANSSNFTASDTQNETENNSSLSNEASTSSKKPLDTSSLSNHKHQYEKSELTASCGQTGGTLYSCECGDSYMENPIAPSYKHDFKEQEIVVGEISHRVFKCTKCDITALYVEKWWEYKNRFDEVRWYITGKLTPSEDGKSVIESDYELVICGQGAIGDYNEKTGSAPWRRFLSSKLKSVTVASGVTSIGKNAFCYRTAKKQETSFYVGGTVKTIKSGAIQLSVRDMVLENGIETIEAGAISGTQNIYLPLSVTVFGDLGRRNSVRYYYEGELSSLLEIRVENPDIAGSPECTLKERCDWSAADNSTPDYACTVILNSDKIGNGTALFDGKTVKTDLESLKTYIE